MADEGQYVSMFLARKFNFSKKSQTVFHLVLFRAKAGGGVIVSLAIGIAMLVVGVQNQDACKNDGAKYLVVNGSFLLVLSILGCIGACFPKVPSSKFGGVDVGAVAGGGGGLAGLIILIWGSVTVFGKLYY